MHSTVEEEQRRRLEGLLCLTSRGTGRTHARKRSCRIAGAHKTAALRGALGPARALHDPHPEVRQAVARALGQQSTPEAVAALCSALHDPHPEVRQAAAEALGKNRTPETSGALCAALHDPVWHVRRAAAQALEQQRTAEASAALYTVLQHTDLDVRAVAVEALGWHPTPEAVAALCTAFKDTDWQISEAAAKALHHIAEALEETQDTGVISPLLTVARRTKLWDIWEALWHFSQRASIWIDIDGQWHPLSPVEPALQNMTKSKHAASF